MSFIYPHCHFKPPVKCKHHDRSLPAPVCVCTCWATGQLYSSCQQSAAPPPTEGQAGSVWHKSLPVVVPIGSTTTSVPETTRSPAPLQQQQQQAPGTSPLPAIAQTQPQQPQFPPGVKLETQRPPSMLQQQPPQPPPQPQQQQQTVQRNEVPSLLLDLVVPCENVKQKGGRVSSGLGKKCAVMLICAFTCASSTAAHRMANLDQVHKLLDGGYSNMPQPQDTEK